MFPLIRGLARVLLSISKLLHSSASPETPVLFWLTEATFCVSQYRAQAQAQGSPMEAASRIFPAVNAAAFHNETPTGNNSPRVPGSRMCLNDLKKWPHEGSAIIYLSSVGFSSQKKMLCRAARQPQAKFLGLDITNQHKCCELS